MRPVAIKDRFPNAIFTELRRLWDQRINYGTDLRDSNANGNDQTEHCCRISYSSYLTSGYFGSVFVHTGLGNISYGLKCIKGWWSLHVITPVDFERKPDVEFLHTLDHDYNILGRRDPLLYSYLAQSVFLCRPPDYIRPESTPVPSPGTADHHAFSQRFVTRVAGGFACPTKGRGGISMIHEVVIFLCQRSRRTRPCKAASYLLGAVL